MRNVLVSLEKNWGEKMRFIHFSDCHLGYYQYGIKERADDFMKSFSTMMKGKGDFMLISGDFFHQRQVDPNTVYRAIEELKKPKEKGMPVYVIPGNHDKHLKNMSWLQFIAKSGYITLIENGFVDHDENTRIFGFVTYEDFEKYIEKVGELDTISGYNIMMLHEGIEGHIPGEGITMDQVQTIKEQGIDYLALGHIHSPYDIGGWVYNPGSLERTSISDNIGCAYLVNTEHVDTDKFVNCKKHDVRKIYKVVINVTNKTDDEIRKEIKERTKDNEPEGILSLKFEGKVERIFNAKEFAPDVFHVLIANDTTFKSSPIDIKDVDDIEGEVIRQVTKGRPDIRKLILELKDTTGELKPDEIMEIVRKAESGDENAIRDTKTKERATG